LEALLKPEAKERQKEHGGAAPGKEKNTSGKFPKVSKGQTRDKVAEGVGVSPRNLSKMHEERIVARKVDGFPLPAVIDLG
jgi:hypothetical protein